MSTPDFVDETLRFIDNGWKTVNFDPQPALIDQRDSRRLDTGERNIEWDLEQGNAVSVGDSPGDSYTPEGLGWHSERVDAGVSVRIEGLHESEYGGIADARDFKQLVDEVKRTLNAVRKRPLPGYWRLEVEEKQSFSTENHDYFRQDLAVGYVGLEQLP